MSQTTAAHTWNATEHGIDRHRISSAAFDVVRTLQKRGFSAYLVGGCVRDLLLNKTPKDFDVVTSARPEQIRRFFSRAFVIGRRFRLVQVALGGEIIEVSTFRRTPQEHESDTTEHGRLLSDNIYGNEQEDALRRDFTINALFYDPVAELILDYCHGVEDIDERLLRIIGDPEKRLREDPVRMLRAIRLASKLELHIDKATSEWFEPLAPLLHHIPPARLMDEESKLVQAQCLYPATKLLHHYQLDHVFPLLQRLCQGQSPMAQLVLAESDNENLSIAPENHAHFIFAALIWDMIHESVAALLSKGTPPFVALHTAISQTYSTGEKFLSKNMAGVVRDILVSTWRLEKATAKNSLRLLALPQFAVAMDFLRLKVQAGHAEPAVLLWWETLLGFKEHEQRVQWLKEQPANSDSAAKKKRKRKKKTKPAADSESQ